MEPTLRKVTLSELRAAFAEWSREYAEHPETFLAKPSEDYDSNCASYFFNLIEAAQAGA